MACLLLKYMMHPAILKTIKSVMKRREVKYQRGEDEGSWRESRREKFEIYRKEVQQ